MREDKGFAGGTHLYYDENFSGELGIGKGHMYISIPNEDFLAMVDFVVNARVPDIVERSEVEDLKNLIMWQQHRVEPTLSAILNRLQTLENANPKTCQCKHSESRHRDGIGKPRGGRSCKDCNCQEYFPQGRDLAADLDYFVEEMNKTILRMNEWAATKNENINTFNEHTNKINAELAVIKTNIDALGRRIDGVDEYLAQGVEAASNFDGKEPITAMDDPIRNEKCAICNHMRGEHMGADGLGPCDFNCFGGPDPCNCRKFVRAVDSAPLDKVLVAIAILYPLLSDKDFDLKTSLRSKWRDRTNIHHLEISKTESAILAYGKQGAK